MNVREEALIIDFEFKFVTVATNEMLAKISALGDRATLMARECDPCSKECDGCGYCDDQIHRRWHMRSMKLLNAEGDHATALLLANVLPESSIWDVVDTLKEPGVRSRFFCGITG